MFFSDWFSSIYTKTLAFDQTINITFYSTKYLWRLLFSPLHLWEHFENSLRTLWEHSASDMMIFSSFCKIHKRISFNIKFANWCHQSQFFIPDACDNTCLPLLIQRIQINFLNSDKVHSLSGHVLPSSHSIWVRCKIQMGAII